MQLKFADLESKPVDILKKFAGSVPASSNIKKLSIPLFKANTPIKWNFLSKVTLVEKVKLLMCLLRVMVSM